MLKILDGKCKMGEVDKLVMAALYDAVRDRPGQRFGAAEHTLIATAHVSTLEAKTTDSGIGSLAVVPNGDFAQGSD